jgi:hypothetical protein
MKFFRRNIQRSIKSSPGLINPTFGEMTLNRGSWVSYQDFPQARELVEVSVWGTEGPSIYQQAVWQKLIQQFTEIAPLIEEALFQEFVTVLNSADDLDVDDLYLTDEYRPMNPTEIWKIAHPVSIDIYPEGYSSEYDCRIYYAFPIDREHNRSVFLLGSKLVFVMPE